jgi:uncharacterized protein
LSLEWLHRAAEQNHATAQCDLGIACEARDGVAPDPAQAAKWYKRAAYNGDYDAQVRFATLHAEGKGVEHDAEQAYIWFTVAARRQALSAEASENLRQAKSEISQAEFALLEANINHLERIIEARRTANPLAKLSVKKAVGEKV